MGGNTINYYSNPRILHPDLGVPMGDPETADMSRSITERRFDIAKKGDESRDCYTCNTYSGKATVLIKQQENFILRMCVHMMFY